MEIETTKIRKLALALLDDQDGINETAYNILADILNDTGHRDILKAIKGTNWRYYLPSGWGLIDN